MKQMLTSFASLLAFFAAANLLAQSPSDDGLDKLAHLQILKNASTTGELIDSVKPTFSWEDVSGETFLLWIEHDAQKKPVVRLNQVYHLELPGHGRNSYLFQADQDFVSGAGTGPTTEVCYTEFRARPSVIARDGKQGVVYWVTWPSPMLDGTGHVELCRNIFLFCDAAHVWHLIGEGPETGHGHSGPLDASESSLKPAVKWTGNTRFPVQVLCTLDTHHFGIGVGPNDPENPELDVYKDAVMTVGGPMATGPEYVVISKAETVDSLAFRIARWYESVRTQDARKRARSLEHVRDCLLQANPDLSKDIPVGSRIVVPRFRVSPERW